MREPLIYLDNAASTPVADEVLSEMLPYFAQQYGNPSSIHTMGRETSRAIELARRRVAALVGAAPKEILFTSGGTESDNLAIQGVANSSSRRRIIASSIEHDAVLEVCRDLSKKGFEISYLPATKEGLVTADALEKQVGDDVALVSVMLANNEVGTVQPIKELASIAHRHGAVFHTDAVQAAGKIPVNAKELGIDLMSLSSHKINGPKGAGALYVRSGVKLAALMHGGGQESHLRSGTENVPAIIGFGKACELAREKLNNSSVSELRDYLAQRVIAEIPHSRMNGHPSQRLPGNCHFTFLGVNGEDLIIKLDENGIAASTGSACSVRKQKESHVLKAMGFSFEEVNGSLRLSIGPQNTREEIDRAVAVLSRTVAELRAISPFRAKYS